MRVLGTVWEPFTAGCYQIKSSIFLKKQPNYESEVIKNRVFPPIFIQSKIGVQLWKDRQNTKNYGLEHPPNNSENAVKSINCNFWSSPSMFYHETSLKSSECALFDGLFTFSNLTVFLSFEGHSKSGFWPKSEFHQKWLFWDPRGNALIAKKSKLNCFYGLIGAF